MLPTHVSRTAASITLRSGDGHRGTSEFSPAFSQALKPRARHNRGGIPLVDFRMWPPVSDSIRTDARGDFIRGNVALRGVRRIGQPGLGGFLDMRGECRQ